MYYPSTANDVKRDGLYTESKAAAGMGLATVGVPVTTAVASYYPAADGVLAGQFPSDAPESARRVGGRLAGNDAGAVPGPGELYGNHTALSESDQ